MKYSIKPYIHNTDENLRLFFTEIHQMDISEIQDGIDSCFGVMNNEDPELSWGSEVSELLIRKESSTLEYHGKFVAEIPTVEILNMLKAYRDKLIEYENDAKR
jgi:hypothetical protein